MVDYCLEGYRSQGVGRNLIPWRFFDMNNSRQYWAKPELVRLGKLRDVAGNSAINADGVSPNPKS